MLNVAQQKFEEAKELANKRIAPLFPDTIAPPQDLRALHSKVIESIDNPTLTRFFSPSRLEQTVNKMLGSILPATDNSSTTLQKLHNKSVSSVSDAAIVVFFSLSVLASLGALALALYSAATLSAAIGAITDVAFNSWAYLSAVATIGGVGYATKPLIEFKIAQRAEKKLALKNSEVSEISSAEPEVSTLKEEIKAETEEVAHPPLKKEGEEFEEVTKAEIFEANEQSPPRSASPTLRA